jgi:hypothetical protein
MQERMEMKAAMRASNEMFEALQGSIISLRDIHQARKGAIQEEIIAKLGSHQDRMEANKNA